MTDLSMRRRSFLQLLGLAGAAPALLAGLDVDEILQELPPFVESQLPEIGSGEIWFRLGQTWRRAGLLYSVSIARPQPPAPLWVLDQPGLDGVPMLKEWSVEFSAQPDMSALNAIHFTDEKVGVLLNTNGGTFDVDAAYLIRSSLEFYGNGSRWHGSLISTGPVSPAK